MHVLKLGRAEEAPLHVADRAVNGAGTELAVLAQGVSESLQESVAIGDVQRSARSVDLVVGELDRRHDAPSPCLLAMADMTEVSDRGSGLKLAGMAEFPLNVPM